MLPELHNKGERQDLRVGFIFILSHTMNNIIHFHILTYFPLPSSRATGSVCAPASLVRIGLTEQNRKCEL